MPKSKLRQRYEARLAAEQQNAASATNTHGTDVNQIDWTSFDNPFILPDGVELYEAD